MMRTLAAAGVVMLGTVLVGCAGSGSAKPVAQASDAQRAALLDRVKGLAGEWDMLDDSGAVIGKSRFSVSSNGSSVRELMFMGTAHEMTNMYHMDGSDMVVTHYCAEGNQPRMRAKAAGADRIPFAFESVTNLKPGGEYMGGLTLVWEKDGTVRQEWVTFKDGKPQPAFSLRMRRGA